MVAVVLNLILPQESEDRQLTNDLNDRADVESQEGSKKSSS